MAYTWRLFVYLGMLQFCHSIFVMFKFSAFVESNTSDLRGRLLSYDVCFQSVLHRITVVTVIGIIRVHHTHETEHTADR